MRGAVSARVTMSDPNDPSLISICGEVLLSKACQTINFFYQDYHISGYQYNLIYYALSQDPYRLQVYEAFMPPTAGAYYYEKGLYLNRLMNHAHPFYKFALVHECTHAIEDFMTRKVVRTLDSEVAAFIAAALYERHNNPFSEALLNDLSVGDNQVFSVARRVVAGLDQPGITITPAAVAPLIQAVLKDPTEGPEISNNPLLTEMGYFT
jgi:hypothetical protein